MLDEWKKILSEQSGNLTTNQSMPARLATKLLEEDESLKEKLEFSEALFTELDGLLNEINGMRILAGLQDVKRNGYITLFRGVRFPTYKRIYETVYEHGYATLNYEQERILELYKNENYSQKREQIKKDPLFWTQPQERVVQGLPLFHLVNDALQIHRAFRNDKDRTAMIAIHIPYELLENKTIRLISNSAIDLDYANTERDFEIKDFIKTGDEFSIDFEALRARGIDLQEMYASDLPWNINEAEKIGIAQDFFLLDIYKINETSAIEKLKQDTDVLKQNRHFLRGFFGDQNVFGRRPTSYLPYKCQIIKKK